MHFVCCKNILLLQRAELAEGVVEQVAGHESITVECCVIEGAVNEHVVQVEDQFFVWDTLSSRRACNWNKEAGFKTSYPQSQCHSMLTEGLEPFQSAKLALAHPSIAIYRYIHSHCEGGGGNGRALKSLALGHACILDGPIRISAPLRSSSCLTDGRLGACGPGIDTTGWWKILAAPQCCC